MLLASSLHHLARLFLERLKRTCLNSRYYLRNHRFSIYQSPNSLILVNSFYEQNYFFFFFYYYYYYYYYIIMPYKQCNLFVKLCLQQAKVFVYNKLLTVIGNA